MQSACNTHGSIAVGLTLTIIIIHFLLLVFLIFSIKGYVVILQMKLIANESLDTNPHLNNISRAVTFNLDLHREILMPSRFCRDRLRHWRLRWHRYRLVKNALRQLGNWCCSGRCHVMDDLTVLLDLTALCRRAHCATTKAHAVG